MNDDAQSLIWSDPALDRVLARHITAFLDGGDPAELASLVRVTEPRLRAYLHLRCPDAGCIDDLAQDTYLRCFRKLGALEDRERFRAFLFGVARNVAREHYRKTNRDLKLIDSYQREMASVLARIAEPANAGAESSLSRRREVLSTCLARLPEYRRQLLTRRYIDGVGAEELSRHSHLSPGGVRTLLRRIRLQLQDCIRSQLGFPHEPTSPATD